MRVLFPSGSHCPEGIVLDAKWFHGLAAFSYRQTSSETQGQSIGQGEKARRKNEFKRRRKSPLVPTLTGLFPNGQTNAGSWLGTKNALYCAQSAKSFSWVLFVSSYTTAIISPQLPGSFTKLSYPDKGTTDESKTFRMLSAGAIQFALRKFCFWRITMYHK